MKKKIIISLLSIMAITSGCSQNDASLVSENKVDVINESTEITVNSVETSYATIENASKIEINDDKKVVFFSDTNDGHIIMATFDELILCHKSDCSIVDTYKLPENSFDYKFFDINGGVGLVYKVKTDDINYQIYYTLLDNNFNVVIENKEISNIINDIDLNFTISKDGTIIAVIDDFYSKISIYNLDNLDSKEIVHEVNETYPVLTSIEFIGNDTIAFTKMGKLDNKTVRCVGTIEIDGSNYLEQSNDYVDAIIQATNTSAFWNDKNMELSQESSGTIQMYVYGEIIEYTTKYKNESQDAFVSKNNKYFATNYDDIFRIYSIINGDLITEIRGNGLPVINFFIDDVNNSIIAQTQNNNEFYLHYYTF